MHGLFNTDDSLWEDTPGRGTHAAYPVLTVIQGDIFLTKPDGAVDGREHLARFVNQRDATTMLERTGWLLERVGTDHKAYTPTQYERQPDGTIAKKGATKP